MLRVPGQQQPPSQIVLPLGLQSAAYSISFFYCTMRKGQKAQETAKEAGFMLSATFHFQRSAVGGRAPSGAYRFQLQLVVNFPSRVLFWPGKFCCFFDKMDIIFQDLFPRSIFQYLGGEGCAGEIVWLSMESVGFLLADFWRSFQ